MVAGVIFVSRLRNAHAVCNAYAMQQTKLISAKEKAAELGISRSTLSRWVEANKITPAYIGEGDNGIQLFTPETNPVFGDTK